MKPNATLGRLKAKGYNMHMSYKHSLHDDPRLAHAPPRHSTWRKTSPGDGEAPSSVGEAAGKETRAGLARSRFGSGMREGLPMTTRKRKSPCNGHCKGEIKNIVNLTPVFAYSRPRDGLDFAIHKQFMAAWRRLCSPAFGSVAPYRRSGLSPRFGSDLASFSLSATRGA